MDGSSFTLVWDSNSTLYDSLDVTSIKRQLDSAIAGRSLADHSLAVEVAAAGHGRKKQQSRLSKSLQKLLRLVLFRSKRREVEVRFKLAQRYGDGDQRDDSELYGCSYPVRWSGGGLASIPEVSEKGLESPEFDYSAVRRAVSERFPCGPTSGVLIRINPPAASSRD
ncbi:hypothetical protein KSP39_PZI013702 [Platanthera zijinensis]|uniref:Uncharacterized protein n=1 Tax=Platanthera zijinensis TaxID=2320716 RepID=A0AAP0BF35_9ASPA